MTHCTRLMFAWCFWQMQAHRHLPKPPTDHPHDAHTVNTGLVFVRLRIHATGFTHSV